MKRSLQAGLMLLAVAGAAAQEHFTERLTPAERHAAGLDQLTPEQLAALNTLVRRDREGGEKEVRAQVRAEVMAETREQARTEVRREEQERKVAETRVLSRIVGRYEGWSGGTVFRLENGQVWRHTGSDVRYVKLVEAPPVLIEKVFGGWRFYDAAGGWCPVVRVK